MTGQAECLPVFLRDMMMEQYIITKDGVRIFCRIEGNGPPLLLIHGAVVDADFFCELSAVLSKTFQVISYDRRGYTRSAPGETYSLAAQAEDAAQVLEQLTGGPAAVVGCSLGALIAMRLCASHPELTPAALFHEPPLLCLGHVTTGREEELFAEIRHLRKAGKYKQALVSFLSLTSGAGGSRPYPPEKIDQQLKNGVLFMEREFDSLLHSDPEMYGIGRLQGRKNLFCLAGEESRDHYAAKAGRRLAARLGSPLLYTPSGHNAARDLPAEFAAMAAGILQLLSK